MKASWRKLKEFTRHHLKEKAASSYGGEKGDTGDIAKRMQKVQEMRRFYQGFHKASSNVAVSAHGFSEAIQNMGKYLVSNTSMLDDGVDGNLLRIVGKVQLEVCQLLDHYAVHVSNILTVPTESMLQNVQSVEDMKLKYDEKRRVYDRHCLLLNKGRMKNLKGETYSERQLQTEKQQVDEIALSVGCRVLSLEQERFHNITTNVSRHHSAQMILFRKAFASLNKIEPYIGLIARQWKIDRQIYVEDLHNDSEDDIDQNMNVANTRNDEENPVSSSSREQEPTPGRIADEDRFAASTCNGSRSAPVSPVRLPHVETIETFQDLPVKNSLKNIKGSSPRTSTSFEHDQKLFYSFSEVGRSASPLTIRSISRLSEQIQISCVEDLQEESMEGECSISMSIDAQTSASSTLKKNYSTLSDQSLSYFVPQPSASISTPLPPLVGEDFSLVKLDSSASSQGFYGANFRSNRAYSKRQSQSGPLTSVGNFDSDKFDEPTPGLIPSRSNADTQSFLTSSPLGWSPGFRRSIARRPPVSPPHISELYELPPPPGPDSGTRHKGNPMSFMNARSNSFQIPARSSSTNAAPLPRPPPYPESQVSSSSSYPQKE